MAGRIRLIHWNVGDARQRADQLRQAGYRVGHTPPKGSDDLKKLARHPPDAVVIDLSRLPANGRDLALHLRSRAKTRHIPLVFVGGEQEKVDKVRALLPDAVFTSWRGVRGAVKRAIATPPTRPVKPSSVLAGYSGTPLPRKLGIKSDSVVALVDAPDDLAQTIGGLPDGASLRRGLRGSPELILWFVTSRKKLTAGMARMAARVGRDGIWIAWPKRASGMKTDVTQNDVRRIGLDGGLVDFKICAIDATWSGLKFTRRKS